MSTLSVLTNTSTMVDKFGNCQFKDVLAEAFSNSIQAEATKITCQISGDNFETVKIIDNGEGFTTVNIKSFETFLSEHKKDRFGSKGMGRLSYLYLYRDVKIESVFNENGVQNTATINFNIKDWVKHTVKNDSKKQDESQTVLTLNGYRRERRGSQIQLEKVVEYLKSHLLPMIILNEEIEISITYLEKSESYTISKGDIPKNINTITTKIESTEFTIKIALSQLDSPSEQSKPEAYYIAGQRTAGKISIIKPITGYTLYFLVESTFLDTHVSDNRDKIEFPTSDSGDNLYLSKDTVENKLLETLQEYIRDNQPQIIEDNNKNVKKIVENQPYLGEYIPKNPLLNENEIGIQANKGYQKAKEELRAIRTHIKESPKTKQISDIELDDFLDKAIVMGTKILAEYINDRQSIIEVLDQMVTNKERVEKKLHNLFLEQKVSDTNTPDKISLTTNNLWLIDDKFMTYNYAASDLKIQEILHSIGGVNSESNDRPDIGLFFGDQNNQDKAVIIEIKPYGITDYDKEKGIQQLLKYAEEFQKKLQTTQQWYYLITDLSEDFTNLLRRNQFKPLFSHKDSIYFSYNEPLKTYIYIISYSSLIADAKSRNQIFLDQFIKNIPLNKIL